jgi:hypothetical protein
MGFAALVGLAVAAGFDGTGRSMATGVLILGVAGWAIHRLMIKR